MKYFIKIFKTLCIVLMLLTSSYAKHHKQTTRKTTPASTQTHPHSNYNQQQSASLGNELHGFNQQPQQVIVHHVQQQPSSSYGGGLGTVGGLAIGGLAGNLFKISTHFVNENCIYYLS